VTDSEQWQLPKDAGGVSRPPRTRGFTQARPGAGTTSRWSTDRMI